MGTVAVTNTVEITAQGFFGGTLTGTGYPGTATLTAWHGLYWHSYLAAYPWLLALLTATLTAMNGNIYLGASTLGTATSLPTTLTVNKQATAALSLRLLPIPMLLLILPLAICPVALLLLLFRHARVDCKLPGYHYRHRTAGIHGRNSHYA